MNKNRLKQIKVFEKFKDDGGLWFRGIFTEHNGYGDVSRYSLAELSKVAKIHLQALGIYYDQLLGLGYGDILRPSELKPLGPSLTFQPIFDITPSNKTKSAIWTMHESSRLSPRWVDMFNGYDLIIVPNNENASTFRNAVKTPVEVVPQGLDSNLFSYQTHSKSDVFTFGAAGDLRHNRSRKGVDRALSWFLAAFPGDDNVRLRLKINASELSLDCDDPRVEVIARNLPEHEMVKWIGSLDCFVDASTFEGWGMWAFNAMGCGRPVIGTYYSAKREYFKFGNHIPIGYNLEPATEIYSGLGDWGVPDKFDGIEAMRWAASNLNKCREIGKQAASDVSKFTWAGHTQGILAALKKHDIWEPEK